MQFQGLVPKFYEWKLYQSAKCDVKGESSGKLGVKPRVDPGNSMNENVA